MTEVLIWIITIPVAAFFSWAVWTWPTMALRITSGVLFGGLWLSALWLANMDLVWRLAVPILAVAAMIVRLVKWSGQGRRAA
jgi:hypothetical protein